MKIQLVEAYHTQNIKASIEFDPSQFKELDGMTEDEIVKYIELNSSDMYLTEEDRENDWSLYDTLMDQDDMITKEKNYETFIYIDKD